MIYFRIGSSNTTRITDPTVTQRTENYSSNRSVVQIMIKVLITWCLYLKLIGYFISFYQTLTADHFGEHYLSSGVLDLWGKTIHKVTSVTWNTCRLRGHRNIYIYI